MEGKELMNLAKEILKENKSRDYHAFTHGDIQELDGIMYGLKYAFKNLYTEEQMVNIANACFGLYRDNCHSDSELEEEVLPKIIKYHLNKNK